MIEVKNIVRKYQMGKETIVALNDVSLKIEDGEFLAIIGPSGSGKSTMMHIIGGLDTPTSGQVLFDGKDISGHKDKEMARFRNQEIGFVFQAFNLENTQTALENVMMPLIFSGMSKSERKKKAMKALEQVELANLAKHKPSEMSGGQRQRVSIARALVNDPKIIFADEPTGNLDSKTGENIMKLFHDLNAKGYTFIMVTHNPEEAEKARRVVHIRDGNITSDSASEGVK
ncbi:MAG: ABC transporter ATP-binding protein [Sarcina sp.]